MTIKKDGNYFKITSNIGAPVSKIDEGEELITKVVAGKSFPDPLPNVSPISSSPSPPPLVLPPLKTDKTSFPNSSNEMQSNPIALPSPLSSESSTPYGKKTSWKDKISNYLTACLPACLPACTFGLFASYLPEIYPRFTLYVATLALIGWPHHHDRLRRYKDISTFSYED